MRRKKDVLRQYHTQLNLLNNTLTNALASLRSMIDGVIDTHSSGEVYEACRIYDQSLLQLRRMWAYFQSKFDQRDDPNLAQVLAAADEIAWSCYKEVFMNLEGPDGERRQTTPLPYIEADYSPRAIPRDDPPGNLNTDPKLRQLIQKLPIPIVSLPPVCVQEPWWLIYLGHEIGHHIQHDLAPDGIITQRFASLLQQTALDSLKKDARRDDADRAARWGTWKEEIFADLCSLYSMGPWAARAIIELELADNKTMLGSKPRYPSSAIRLKLLAHTIKTLGLSVQDALGDFPLETLFTESLKSDTDNNEEVRFLTPLRQNAQRDAMVIPACISAVITTPLLDQYTFQDLYNWKENAEHFAPYKRVAIWKESLLASDQLYPEETLQAPRMIISGAMAAWVALTAIEDTKQRKEAYTRLAQRLLPLLKDSREPGVRGVSETAQPDATHLGDIVAQQLVQDSTTSLE